MTDHTLKEQIYRYYSTQRPIGINTFPVTDGFIGFQNFNARRCVENGKFQAWGYLEYRQPLTEQQINAYELRPIDISKKIKYYPINEETNGLYEHEPGEVTKEYHQCVDHAIHIAERQKAQVEPSYHEKIDWLTDTYARLLARNMNERLWIDSRLPWGMIDEPMNFSGKQKKQQPTVQEKNVRERQKIQGLLDQIRQVGMKSGRSNDSIMVQKLEAKLTELENKRQNMKAVNAYHRHHKTLDGYTDIHPSFIQKLKNNMSRNEQADTKPFSDSDLSRNSAKIYRIKSKIQELTEHQETIFRGWQFGGGSIKANTEDNRLQIFFDIKPDAATRMDMKKNGFRWAPRVGAWQRPLNKKAIEAADRIERIRPIAQKENTEWDNQNGNNGSRDENEREQEP